MHFCLLSGYNLNSVWSRFRSHTSESSFKEYSQKLLQAFSLDSIIKQCNMCVQGGIMFYSLKHVLYHKWQLFPCKRVVKSINIIYTLCTLFYKNAIEKTLYKIDKWIMSIEIIQWNTKWFIIVAMYDCKQIFYHLISTCISLHLNVTFRK